MLQLSPTSIAPPDVQIVGNPAFNHYSGRAAALQFEVVVGG